MKYSRVIIPKKVIDRLYDDERFFNGVLSSGKINEVKFPRSDQWVEGEDLYISFALAGYSKEDILINLEGRFISIKNKNKMESKIAMSKGIISRGIAGRNFEREFYIHDHFDVSKMTASMNDGLLVLRLPIIKLKVTEVTIN